MTDAKGYLKQAHQGAAVRDRAWFHRLASCVVVVVSNAWLGCVSRPCPSTTPVEPQVTQLQANRTLQGQYRTVCRARCQANLRWCSTECAGGEDVNTTCQFVCAEILNRVHCADGDERCMRERGDGLAECLRLCPPHTFCTGCGLTFSTCLDDCERTPKCLTDSDCGPNAVCQSGRCIDAPACSSAKRCQAGYVCWQGHCWAS